MSGTWMDPVEKTEVDGERSHIISLPKQYGLKREMDEEASELSCVDSYNSRARWQRIEYLQIVGWSTEVSCSG